MNQNISSGEDIPDEATLEFLKCAFPNGLDEEEYFPLLHVLLGDMTIRAASWLVGILLSKHYMDIYNDALYAKSSYVPDSTVVESLTKRLEECGYSEWLKG